MYIKTQVYYRDLSFFFIFPFCGYDFSTTYIPSYTYITLSISEEEEEKKSRSKSRQYDLSIVQWKTKF